MKWVCQILETAAIQIFAKHGLLSFNRLSASFVAFYAVLIFLVTFSVLVQIAKGYNCNNGWYLLNEISLFLKNSNSIILNSSCGKQRFFVMCMTTSTLYDG